MKLSDLLGLNARNFYYTSKYNPKAGKKIADHKLLTKSTLKKSNLSTPRLYKAIRNHTDLDKFDFSKIADSFVVKPNRGMGGKGIIVIEKPGDDLGTFITSEGEIISSEDLSLHVNEILEGRFSMADLPDTAFIEERVRIHPSFVDYAYQGTPDIGVIVFNQIPIMAFLRLPTRESGGRANLFQGAIACGIDLSSGTTTHAIMHANFIQEHPDTHKLLRGIIIPEWDSVLKLAVESASSANLGYMRADIVLQPSLKTPGKTIPKVLELNAQPGLKIQLCNRAGLKRRLERVEDLNVENPEHGIRIAKELFGENNSVVDLKLRKIGVFEEVSVMDLSGNQHSISAKIDTGAFRTSIDINLAKDLGLLHPDNYLMTKSFESALGVTERDVVGITFTLAGKTIHTSASVSDRSGLKRPMLIGRRDLTGFNIVV